MKKKLTLSIVSIVVILFICVVAMKVVKVNSKSNLAQKPTEKSSTKVTSGSKSEQKNDTQESKNNIEVVSKDSVTSEEKEKHTETKKTSIMNSSTKNVNTNNSVNKNSNVNKNNNVNKSKENSQKNSPKKSNAPRDEEILQLINNAQYKIHKVLHSRKGDTLECDGGCYIKFSDELNSPQKLNNYLNGVLTQNEINRLLKFVGAKYIEKDYCEKVGDIGIKYEILKAKITKKETRGNETYVTLSVNADCGDGPYSKNYKIINNNGKKYIDHYEGTFGEI